MDMKRKLREFFTLKRHANDGFTLVELIVVIAIVAILGGVAVPAYSGYIEKADAAADAQIIADINKAFAAACMVEGLDNYNASGATASVNAEGKLENVTAPGAGTNFYQDVFKPFFDNEGAFKKTEALYYDATIGGFGEGIGVTYTLPDGSTVTIAVSKAMADLLNASTFMTNEDLGVSGLMDKLDMVTSFAGAILTGDAENGSLALVLQSDDFLRSFAKYMNIDVGNKTGEELQAAIGAWNTDANGDPIYSEEESASMMANALVMYAAQNSTMDKASATALLGTAGLDAKQSIVNTLTGSNGAKQDTAAAMAQAAMAYGMFTSYAYHTGDEELIKKANDADNPVSVLHELNSTGFKNYINSAQGQKDLDGYLSSMGMINDGTANNAVAGDIVMDGFGNNTDLETLLKDALSK